MLTADAVLNHAREFIADAGEGETIKARLRSAARALGIPYGTAKRIRYGEVKTIPAHVFETMAERYGEVLKRCEKQSSENLQRYRERLQTWGVTREATSAADGAAGPDVGRQ